MVNGNYCAYGERPLSETQVVDDHVQKIASPPERKPHRKSPKSSESPSPKIQQRDNETDSVKYEKKVKEPRLLRYVPNTDVEENFVAEKFETYDLAPETEERPRRHAFTKKPKNPSDGSINYAYSRSNSSSPNRNLPTISEYGEQFQTFRTRVANSNELGSSYYESPLNKYFSKTSENTFEPTIKYDGTHPDSLYRVSNGSLGLGDGKMARLVHALRWPAALLLVCATLAVFVFFLMPANLSSDKHVNSTDWESGVVSAGVRLPVAPAHKHPPAVHKRRTTTARPSSTTTAAVENDTTRKPHEIDFYDAESEKNDNLVTIISSTPGVTRRPAVKPVFPSHLTPEVQYGDKDKGRTPKVFDEKNHLPEDSTLKPQITQKPEKPLAIYFKEARDDLKLDTFSRADSTVNHREKNKAPVIDPFPIKPFSVERAFQRYQPGRANIPVTSGHSKIFGLGIEDIGEITMPTTQSSTYNTRVSPTLPTWRSADTTTKNYPVTQNSEVPQCQSPRLAMCRGVLPYDLAGPAALSRPEGVSAKDLLSDLQFLISTNCSSRARQFICGLLEPECSPPPFSPKKPCYSLCRLVADDCDGFIFERISWVFQCNSYETSNCMPARAPCAAAGELSCGDGSCVAAEWRCNGQLECANGQDEKNCSQCKPDQFYCPSGGCIDRSWMCDGIDDCPQREDESALECLKRELSTPAALEPGSEGAGSAPEPSVRRFNNLSGDKQRGEFRAEESSKELLITSDSTNALKRNFTRRPWPARLTPYKPKVQEISDSTKPPPFSRPYITEEDSKNNDPMLDRSMTRNFAPEEPSANKNKKKEHPFSRAFVEEETPINNGRRQKVQPWVETQKHISAEDDGPIEEFIKSPGSVTRAPPRRPNTIPPQKNKNSTTDDKFERYIDGASIIRQAAKEEEEERQKLLRAPNPELEVEKEEASLSKVETASGRASPCPSGELRCVDGLCITLAQLCDGTIDCSDHADEDNCFT